MIDESKQPFQDQANQDASVVLSFVEGTLDIGLDCKASILLNGQQIKQSEETFKLPANPSFAIEYQKWKGQRDLVEKARGHQGSIPDGRENRTFSECLQIQENIEENNLRQWFSEPEFKELAKWIAAEGGEYLRQDRSIPIIFDFKEITDFKQRDLLQKLPWHLWSLLRQQFFWAEAVIATDYSRQTNNIEFPVRILAVFGSDQDGLDFSSEKSALENLRETHQAEVDILSAPELSELKTEITKKSWDILFFAGHSRSDQDFRNSQLKINSDVIIKVKDLEFSLNVAITKGLKLLFFNSCDGLGIASFLSTFNHKVPTTIVMKEPVYDKAASLFFVKFIEYFANGYPLYRATKLAREDIASLKNARHAPVPAANWLPVICQNPSQEELNWPVAKTESLPPPPPPVKFGFLNWLKTHSKSLLLAILLLSGATAIWLIYRIFFWPIDGSLIVPTTVNPAVRDDLSSMGEEILIDNSFKMKREKSLDDNKTFAELGSDFYLEGLQERNEDKQKQLYQKAALHFQRSLVSHANDPEILIYLNNIQAKLKDLAGDGEGRLMKTIAVSLPIAEKSGDAEEIIRGVAHAQRLINCGLESDFQSQLEQANDLEQMMPCPNISDQLPILQIKLFDHRGNDIDAHRNEINLTTNSIIEDNQLVAVIGRYTSPVTFNVEEKFNINQMVLFSPTSTAVREDSNANLDNNRYVFRVSPTDEIAAAKLVDYINSQSQGAREVILAWDNNDKWYSTPFKNKIVNKIGETRVLNGGCSNLASGNASFVSSNCIPEIGDDVQEFPALVMLPAYSALGEAADIAQQYRERGSAAGVTTDKLIILGGDTFYEPEVNRQNPDEAIRFDALDGLVLSIPWIGAAQEANKDVFERRADALWSEAGSPNAINWRTVMAYEATRVIAEAIKQSEPCNASIKICRKKLQEKLNSMEPVPDLPTGTVSFNNGERKSSNVELVQVDRASKRFKLCEKDDSNNTYLCE